MAKVLKVLKVLNFSGDGWGSIFTHHATQCRSQLTLPALAALATLEFTWIYNDFFWAVVLEQQGADRPITSSLANLGGEFFIAGLTIGAEKG